jgi:hypothetical protein
LIAFLIAMYYHLRVCFRESDPAPQKAWPDRHFFEIGVEASTTLQLLHFSCLQNQYDMDYANIYHQLKH